MSSNDESITIRPEPKYQLQNNTQSFELICLSSQSSWQYHQVSTTPLSSSTTPTRNSGSGYITSTIHQSPFGGVNQWGTPIVAPTFTPSPYTPLQAVTSTPISTMEVNSSSGRIVKFSERPGTISLREFKATFSTVVCELELKYGTNSTEAFAFKQLVRMCTMRHWMSMSNILQGFWVSPKFPIQLRHSHYHRLSSCIASCNCTSRDCAE